MNTKVHTGPTPAETPPTIFIDRGSERVLVHEKETRNTERIVHEPAAPIVVVVPVHMVQPPPEAPKAKSGGFLGALRILAIPAVAAAMIGAAFYFFQPHPSHPPTNPLHTDRPAATSTVHPGGTPLGTDRDSGATTTTPSTPRPTTTRTPPSRYHFVQPSGRSGNLPFEPPPAHR